MAHLVDVAKRDEPPGFGYGFTTEDFSTEPSGSRTNVSRPSLQHELPSPVVLLSRANSQLSFVQSLETDMRTETLLKGALQQLGSRLNALVRFREEFRREELEALWRSLWSVLAGCFLQHSVLVTDFLSRYETPLGRLFDH